MYSAITLSYRDLKGIVVTLDELGHLACSYLGTDPSVFTAPPPSTSRELNHTEMEKEIKELQRDIRMAEKEGVQLSSCVCVCVVWRSCA